MNAVESLHSPRTEITGSVLASASIIIQAALYFHSYYHSDELWNWKRTKGPWSHSKSKRIFKVYILLDLL